MVISVLEISEIYENKIIINKSEFIGLIYPVKNKSDLEDSLQDVKRKYPKATHYCYAATLGDQREWAQYQDDGEPKGTAGLPILDAMDHHQLTNALLVVVRYYGGILLGAGGLVRAYSSAASEVLKLASFVEKKKVDVYQISFPYHLINQIEHLLNEKGTILEKSFLEMVHFKFYTFESNLSFLDELKHLIQIDDKQEDSIYVPIL